MAGLSWMIALAGVLVCGCSDRSLSNGDTSMQLSHEQTLDWIQQHRAWRLAKKVKPIWARAGQADEIGRPFQTADHATEVAQEGFWLCVGVVGEPWFQKLEKIEAKYDRAHQESKQFSFDQKSHVYQVFEPKGDVRNWAAQVSGPQIEGFYIRPNYDMQHPLYSPTGGYVVKNHVSDPYRDNPDEVWLVQQPLFESTYELLLSSGDAP